MFQHMAVHHNVCAAVRQGVDSSDPEDRGLSNDQMSRTPRRNRNRSQSIQLRRSWPESRRHRPRFRQQSPYSPVPIASGTRPMTALGLADRRRNRRWGTQRRRREVGRGWRSSRDSRSPSRPGRSEQERTSHRITVLTGSAWRSVSAMTRISTIAQLARTIEEFP